MPPKARQIDPELQKAQFEEWKEKDEYRVWAELKFISKELYDISETSTDITGNWQMYHNKFIELAQAFKIKTKIKDIQHTHIRSAFFAVEDIEINKEIIKQYMDGVYYSVEKADKQRATHVKSAYSKIYRTLDANNIEISAENYMAERKNLVTLLNEFFKKLPLLIKQSHKVIDEKLMAVLQPLRKLLDINKKLMFFDLVNNSKGQRMVKDFVLKAQVEQYCLCLQDCIRLLYQPPEPKDKILQRTCKVKLIFNKLAYEDWQQNKIEAFYLTPLQNAFDKMRNNLLCLMLKGINYYKCPLKENEVIFYSNKQFVQDVKELIDAELIAEHLLGNELKRDQLNFMFNVLSVIFNANQLSKEFLLKRDENCINGSVPKLVTYMTILHMRSWLDRKNLDEAKLMKEKSKDQQQQSQMPVTIQEESPAISAYMSVDKRKLLEEEQKKRDEQMKQAEEQGKQQAKLDEEKYGRYWIWDFYCDQQHRQLFEECVENIRHINIAVQQDIQDEIIREGMIPKAKDRKSKDNDASQKINELRMKDNDNEYVKKRRPPELWNFPKIVEEKHTFRVIAEPKKCYVDGRIEDLEEKIRVLSQHLEQFKAPHWIELVSRTIDALKEHYNQEPNSALIVGQ